MKTYNWLHMFCGSGGGALGLARARGRYRHLEGRFATLLGVDIDPQACADFTMLTGAPALCADVAKLTPRELLEATGGVAPDGIFTSPPCKGFSGLLGNARLHEEHYQALNRLVFQGLFLALETWPDTPPKLIALENVPRITSRGAELLRQLRGLLRAYGYTFHEGYHDCGELGGLAQHRRRFLFVARHERQVPTFVYKPPLRRVRAIGEVLGELPMPDDPRGGPMHRLPRLEWRTWVRLALIPAGGDWRALGRKDDGPWSGRGTYGIVPWSEPSATVTGNGRPGAGKFSVADPRLNDHHNNTYRVQEWEKASGCVTGGHSPSCGSACVADPRLPQGRFNNQFRIVRWADPSVAVTGGGTPTSGGVCVADPRPAIGKGARTNLWQVERWEESARCVTGAAHVSGGAPSIADPRLTLKGSYPGLMGVLEWDKPSATISGKAAVTSSNCPASVADPRFGGGADRHEAKFRVEAWDRAAHTVTGSDRVGSGAPSVADPRPVAADVLGDGWAIPADDDRPDPPPLIIALDGTWHRPLTTLELAALQGLPVVYADGKPLVLAGKSHASWRERVGNLVPPAAAEAMGNAFLMALLAVEAGATFVLGGTEVWVEPEARL